MKSVRQIHPEDRKKTLGVLSGKGNYPSNDQDQRIAISAEYSFSDEVTIVIFCPLLVGRLELRSRSPLRTSFQHSVLSIVHPPSNDFRTAAMNQGNNNISLYSSPFSKQIYIFLYSFPGIDIFFRTQTNNEYEYSLKQFQRQTWIKK